MKQKVVILVSLNEQKSRTKVLKIVVSFPGVESASWVGKEGNQVEVVGDGIDAVKITNVLRKKVGYADVVSVSPVEEKKDKSGSDGQKKVEKSTTAPITLVHPTVWSEYPVSYYGNPAFVQVYPQPATGHYDPCSIM